MEIEPGWWTLPLGRVWSAKYWPPPFVRMAADDIRGLVRSPFPSLEVPYLLQGIAALWVTDQRWQTQDGRGAAAVIAYVLGLGEEECRAEFALALLAASGLSNWAYASVTDSVDPARPE